MSFWKRTLFETFVWVVSFIQRVLPVSLIKRAFCLAKLRQCCGSSVPVSTQFDGMVEIIGTGRVRLGENCRLGRGVQLETQGDGEIIIGDNVRINTGCVIASHSKVVIGNDALIGEYVSIRDANHGIQIDQLIRLQKHDASPVCIGNNVWIGRGCCILKGVFIENGVIVGANSVVTKNIAAGCVVVGNSCRVINIRD
mgnify:CR=1 FL=1